LKGETVTSRDLAHNRGSQGRIFRDRVITLSHGGGGKASQNLIEHIFVKALGNPLLNLLEDQAVFTIDGARLAFTTDSYVIDPIFFPGGNIGNLAVNGTINDLAVSGARPLYLSLGVILEEGFPIEDLRRIVDSMREAADVAGVQVVTGDTKVVPRGKADKIFINTSGIGRLCRPQVPSLSLAQPGDCILLSGPIADHGVTILAARGDLELEIDCQSDTAPLNGLVEAIFSATAEVHCLKDPTRGGLATALNEIATHSNVGIILKECAIPIRPDVRAACEILGIDPLYVANEGKLIAVVPEAVAASVLMAMRQQEWGRDSQIIGTVASAPQGTVLLNTDIGGTRIVDTLVGDALPRIC
jgi:hydrogenase expression/formation protein HypE